MTLLSLYQSMARIRAFELAAEEASIGGVAALGQQIDLAAKVRGPLHVSIGQEAVATGVCAHLVREDLLTSSHRGHGHTLAKGANMNRMMAELYGKRDGFNGGKGGSMHIADFSVGMLGANGVVSAGLPIACGAAHAIKLKKKPNIVACFFGDGAANRGPFLESLNWACVYRLPVLFVCEDNRWSATSSTFELTGGPGIVARSIALGVPAHSVDGNDVELVEQLANRLVSEVRSGQGPRLLHASTWRVRGHLSADKQAYRDPEDIAAAVQTDPLTRARKVLLARGASLDDLTAIDESVDLEVREAIAFADQSESPMAIEAFTDVQTLGAGTWH
jgi:TPP-dependent pyruvate/acetoin dehydrogenase alpha subunit